MTMAQNFTIESVAMGPIDESLLVGSEATSLLKWQIVLTARMDDGRRFVNAQWFTQEDFEKVGEARLVQDMRDGAHPPDE